MYRILQIRFISRYPPSVHANVLTTVFLWKAEAAEPQLWTHQRESRSSLAQLSPEKWRNLKTELCEELAGSLTETQHFHGDMSDM